MQHIPVINAKYNLENIVIMVPLTIHIVLKTMYIWINIVQLTIVSL